jgi:apolipoprotein N-acyltransferase
MKKKDIYLVCLSAILFSAGFPPSPLGFVAYFSLVPLLMALENKSPGPAFGIGYLFGLISNTLLLFWVGWATVGGAIAALVLLCLYTAFLCWFYSFVQKRWRQWAVFFFPFMWVAMEYFRSLTEMSFPWLNLAYTQTYYLKLIQYASLWGNYAVSFWILLLNLLVYLLLRRRTGWKTATILFALLLILPYIYGTWAMSRKIDGKRIKIALLQGNMEPEVKWNQDLLDYNMQTYIDMSKAAAKESVDFIIWPETAAPCYLAGEEVYLEKVQRTSDQLDVPLLVGTDDYRVAGGGNIQYFNSAFLFTPHSSRPEVYNKIHLVPFSEKLPYDECLGITKRIQLGQSDFSSGKEYTVFQIPQGKFAVLICFESVYPALVRHFVNRGINFLVNITNDGWFGKTHGPFQHARIAVFRAIENRMAVARCANTGISMFVDPYGRVTQPTRLYVRDMVIGSIPLKEDTGKGWNAKTFYARYGDWFAQACLVLAFVATLAAVIRKSPNVYKGTDAI